MIKVKKQEQEHEESEHEGERTLRTLQTEIQLFGKTHGRKPNDRELPFFPGIQTF